MLGDCGILVPPRQPERFCDAIVSLLQRSDLRADYGRRAQRRALSRFTINSVAGEWESLYNELIARPRRWPAVRRATRIPRWRRHA